MQSGGGAEFQHQTLLETRVFELIDLAIKSVREKEEVSLKFERTEQKQKELSKELEKIKKDKLEEKEILLQKERKSNEEKSMNLLEIEKLKGITEELQAKVDSLQAQNEQLQTERHHPNPQTSMYSNNNGRVSQLVTRDVIEQLSEIFEALKTLENRTTIVLSQVTKADLRAQETDRIVDSAFELLKKSKEQIEISRKQNQMAMTKSRSDQIIISSLQLDIETFQEQINHLREEIASHHQN